MRLIIASNNKNKIIEIKAILGGTFDEILSLDDAGIIHETIEDGETFYENARKKALEINEITGEWCLADDSGLCVDALGGAPGVYSARFSGEHGNDEKNNALLLEKLKNAENRTAYYCASMVLISPQKEEFSAEGRFYGEIATEPKGECGFGYDPLFYLPEYKKTVAQLTPDEKNKISHRAIALQNLLSFLKK